MSIFGHTAFPKDIFSSVGLRVFNTSGLLPRLPNAFQKDYITYSVDGGGGVCEYSFTSSFSALCITLFKNFLAFFSSPQSYSGFR